MKQTPIPHFPSAVSTASLLSFPPFFCAPTCSTRNKALLNSYRKGQKQKSPHLLITLHTPPLRTLLPAEFMP
jgi:hypothetical protein